jgi:P27 family predicted phage terminase small subunit
MPKWMTGYAKECWDTVTAVLAARGQLSPDSLFALDALVQCLVEWKSLSTDLRKRGRTQKVMLTIAGKAGKKNKNDGAPGVEPDDDPLDGKKKKPPNHLMMERARPQVQMFQDCDRRLRAWLVEFGLTDAARAKVNGTSPETPKKDPLAEFGLGSAGRTN